MVGGRKSTTGGRNGKKGDGRERETEEEWEEMKKLVGKVFKEIDVNKKINRKGWWDVECREKKNRVRGELRKWRRGEREN